MEMLPRSSPMLIVEFSRNRFTHEAIKKKVESGAEG
jgi:hypothetical protein